MTFIFPDHPDDAAQRWCDRFAGCTTEQDAQEVAHQARLARVDEGLIRELYRSAVARARGLEALYEALEEAWE